MAMQNSEEKMVSLTEQGNLGLGVHEGQNEQERDLLRQKLEEMQKSTQQK